MWSFIGRYAKLVLFGFITFILGSAFGRNGEIVNLQEETLRGLVTLALFAGAVALIIGAVRAVRNSPQGSFGSWLLVFGGLAALAALVVVAAIGLYTKPEVSVAAESGMLVAFALSIMFIAPLMYLRRESAVVPGPLPE